MREGDSERLAIRPAPEKVLLLPHPGTPKSAATDAASILCHNKTLLLLNTQTVPCTALGVLHNYVMQSGVLLAAISGFYLFYLDSHIF